MMLEQQKGVRLPACDDEIRAGVRAMLVALGYRVDDPAVQKTPDRVVRMVHEFAPQEQPSLTVFPCKGEGGVAAVRHIPIASLCCHHLMPFTGRVTVAYRYEDALIGLSKVARVAQWAAKRATVQETIGPRLIKAMLDTGVVKAAACVVEARHTCMCARGARVDSPMVTYASDAVDEWAGEMRSLMTMAREDHARP